MPPEEESPLAELERKLYTPGTPEPIVAPHLRHEAPPQTTAWAPPPPPLPPKPPSGWKAMPWTSRFLIIAAAFFAIAGIAAALIFLTGFRSVSSENVEIRTQGPVSIGSGDTVSLLITVKNNNPTAITNTNLIVDLPEGSRQAVDKNIPFDHYTDTLGDLAPGEEATRTVNVVLFGAQNQMLAIPIRVEYRAEESNALFATEGQYSVTVTTSPLSLTVSGAAEAASGQPFTLAVAVRSNASTPLENVAVRVDYPPGFTPTQTNPKPTTGTLFALGSLRPGEQRAISITGYLIGTDTDERAFRFSAGTQAAPGDIDIALPYASTDTLVRIARPFLATTLTLNRETGDTITVAPGDSVSGTLTWQNNLTVPVSDARITVSFSGNGFDPANVYTQSGFYRSSDSTILFSKDTNRNLAQLLPGDIGNGTFSLVPKSAAALRGVPNPVITITVSIAGNRIGQSQVPEEVSSTQTRTIRVGTAVEYTSRLMRTGPFANTGPVPPKAGTETTYTVELAATNSVNPIAGAQTTMTLPSYVRFTGAVQPKDGSIVYDDRTRTVTWKVNELAANASMKGYFQIALLPSASQSGTSPVLVSEQSLTGVDRFTQQQITVRGERLTTQMDGAAPGTGQVAP